MMVGLILMKLGSSSQKVKPPNTTTSTAVTTGTGSRRPNSFQRCDQRDDGRDHEDAGRPVYARRE